MTGKITLHHFFYVFALTGLLLVLSGRPATSQPIRILTDSLHQQGQAFLILADSNFLISKDTLVFRRTQPEKETTAEETQTQEALVFDRIRESAYQNRITRELYHLVFRQPAGRRLPDSVQVIESISPFLWFSGQPISKITIIQLDPFGRSVEDTSFREKSLLVQLANHLHMNSRERVIRENLLFREREAVDARSFADTERLLRSLEMVRDARIIVIPADGDSVQVDVVVQDVWAIALDARIHSPDSVSGQVYYRNLFGFGHILETELALNRNEPGRIALRGSLEFENVGGSFLRSRLSWSGLPDYQVREASIGRDFVAEKFKFAGGLVLNETLSRNADDTGQSFRIRSVFRDVWLGRTFQPFGSHSKGRHLVGALRLLQQRFFDHPSLSPTEKRIYYDRILSLGTLAYSQRDYYNSRLVYSPGTTEDIPHGMLIELSLGREFSQNTNRWYGSIEGSFGKYYQAGYLYSGLALGGFLPDGKGAIEEGVLGFHLAGFSRLAHWRKAAFRQFARFNYIRGLNRLPSEQLSLSDQEGIRGLKSPVLSGYHKINIQTESVIFDQTDWIGFSYALYAFTDVGVIGNQPGFPVGNPWYSGLGIGFRIYNDNLFFRAFQIRLAWYPRLPEESSYYLLALSGLSRTGFEDFAVKKPGLIEYK
jgi:hypothetical protein